MVVETPLQRSPVKETTLPQSSRASSLGLVMASGWRGVAMAMEARREARMVVVVVVVGNNMMFEGGIDFLVWWMCWGGIVGL